MHALIRESVADMMKSSPATHLVLEDATNLATLLIRGLIVKKKDLDCLTAATISYRCAT